MDRRLRKIYAMFLRALALILIFAPTLGAANDRLVRLHAPPGLIESGLLKHILPRFSLKTQVRVELVEMAEADLLLGPNGRVLFQGPSRVWALSVRNPDHKGTARLADWLQSEIGQRTIASYQPNGAPLFGPPAARAPESIEVTMDGDAERGFRVSHEKCARCHAVSPETAGWGIGSAPSFGVMRGFDDWEGRFAAFYALNPHPAFTQIDAVTDPFPIDRPSPIAPVVLTLEDVEAILAYVAAMQATDLGDPLRHQ